MIRKIMCESLWLFCEFNSQQILFLPKDKLENHLKPFASSLVFETDKAA